MVTCHAVRLFTTPTSRPRLVRRVGYLRCMRCQRPTFSEDVVGIRICFKCGGEGSVPIGHISELEDDDL